MQFCFREPVTTSCGDFNRILPFPLVAGSHLDRGQREYAPVCVNDRDRAAGVKPSVAFLFSHDARCQRALPVILRVLQVSIPSPPEITCQRGTNRVTVIRSKRTGSNPVEGNRYLNRQSDWASGSGSVANCGTHRIPDTLTDDVNYTPYPRNGRGVAASRCPLSFRPMLFATPLCQSN